MPPIRNAMFVCSQPTPPQPSSSGLLFIKSSNRSPVFWRSRSSGVAAVTASIVPGANRWRSVSPSPGTSVRPAAAPRHSFGRGMNEQHDVTHHGGVERVIPQATKYLLAQ